MKRNDDGLYFYGGPQRLSIYGAAAWPEPTIASAEVPKYERLELLEETVVRPSVLPGQEGLLDTPAAVKAAAQALADEIDRKLVVELTRPEQRVEVEEGIARNTLYPFLLGAWEVRAYGAGGGGGTGAKTPEPEPERTFVRPRRVLEIFEE